MVFFSAKDWRKNPLADLKNIHRSLGSGPWIVRSSCAQEDGIHRSNAGAFLSVANVTEANSEAAVEKVIGSYGRVSAEDEVLIQPMLRNVLRSGVAFSHDPVTCAPYRIIAGRREVTPAG